MRRIALFSLLLAVAVGLCACARPQPIKEEPSPSPTQHKTWEQYPEDARSLQSLDGRREPHQSRDAAWAIRHDGDHNATLTHAVWILIPFRRTGVLVHGGSHLVGYSLEPPKVPVKRWVIIKNQIETKSATSSLGYAVTAASSFESALWNTTSTANRSRSFLVLSGRRHEGVCKNAHADRSVRQTA